MGADIVFTPEIIDKRMENATRVYNEDDDTIEFRNAKNENDIIWRTCEREKKHLVVQLGTASVEYALAAAKVVENDCIAIDVNCGCPVKFSTHNGMGAALLKKPKLIAEIISSLKKNVSVPITCKIRIDPDPTKTVELCRLACEAGVDAITIHARYVEDRSERKRARWGELKHIISEIRALPEPDADSSGSNPRRIPLLGNGDIFEYAHIAKMISETGVDSVMVGRGAMRDLSVFRKEGKLPQLQIAAMALESMARYRYNTKTLKYWLMKMFVGATVSKYYSLVRDGKEYRGVGRAIEMDEARLEHVVSSMEKSIEHEKEKMKLRVDLKTKRVDCVAMAKEKAAKKLKQGSIDTGTGSDGDSDEDEVFTE